MSHFNIFPAGVSRPPATSSRYRTSLLRALIISEITPEPPLCLSLPVPRKAKSIHPGFLGAHGCESLFSRSGEPGGYDAAGFTKFKSSRYVPSSNICTFSVNNWAVLTIGRQITTNALLVNPSACVPPGIALAIKRRISALFNQDTVTILEA